MDLSVFPVIDNFNRANEGPPANGWVTIFGAGLKVLSNQAATDGVSGDNGGWYTQQKYGPDCAVYATIVASGGGFCDLYVRGSGTTAATSCGYDFGMQAATNVLRFFRLDNGVFTQLGTSIAQTITSGDALGGTVVGGTLTMHYKTAAGSWQVMGTVTDSTYTASGYLGMSFNNTTQAYDNFGGGTIGNAAFRPTKTRPRPFAPGLAR